MEHIDAYQFCNAYILPGESILWRGKPEKGNVISGEQLIMIPFSLIFLAFSLFWEYNAFLSGIPIMMIWGIPFVAVGLYLLFGRALHDVMMQNKTYYVITNRKIIIKVGNRINMYDAADLPSMSVRIHKNGNGTITFREIYIGRRGRRYTNFFCLRNLKDVAHAQNAISLMDR